MHYVSQSERGIQAYSLKPIWAKLQGSDVSSPVIGKKADDATKLSAIEKHERYRGTRYPRLDRLVEDHF